MGQCKGNITVNRNPNVGRCRFEADMYNGMCFNCFARFARSEILKEAKKAGFADAKFISSEYELEDDSIEFGDLAIQIIDHPNRFGIMKEEDENFFDHGIKHLKEVIVFIRELKK